MEFMAVRKWLNGRLSRIVAAWFDVRPLAERENKILLYAAHLRVGRKRQTADGSVSLRNH
ncbi:hypothetical protein HB775_30390 (plasmid) [Rhizobium leguminosarum bv. trifolii]|nr:hypothetical protein HB775_30390 [Rhizobium leguminosarum bv. trifolii]